MTTTAVVRSDDGTSIAYEWTGSGPAVILVDAAGNFRGTGLMRDLASQLTDELTAYCYDRRGRGESTDTAPYAVTREVEDIRALVAAVGGSAAVCGFSSGAALALRAAAAEPAIRRLVLLEPAVDLDEPPEPGTPQLAAEVEELVAAGRRGDAYLHFLHSIGVPDEFVEEITQSPVWPELQALAHTLAYDARITPTVTPELLRGIETPTLVVNSASTDERLLAWGERVARELPNGTHKKLPGEWHVVPPDVLAPALLEHIRG